MKIKDKAGLLCLVAFLLPEILYRNIYMKENAIPNVVAILFEIMLCTIILVILLMITKSTKKTAIIAIITNSIYLIANHIKYTTNSVPLLFTDIKFLKNISKIAGLTGNTMGDLTTYIPIIIIIIFAILMLVIVKQLYKDEEIIDVNISNTKRIAIITLLSVIMVFLVVPIKEKDEFILNIIYDIDNRIDYKTDTRIAKYFSKYGILGGLYENLLESRLYPPENYNAEVIAEVMNQEENINSNKYKKPNIIVIFSEAFWDIEKIDEVKFDKRITENFNNLKNEGELIETLSPSYGGLSCDVEFELLTGGNMAYFPEGFVPFITLYSNDDCKNNPSIVNELKNNGYDSTIVFGRDYYNSEKVYDYIGMDEYKEEDVEEFHKGGSVSDKHLTDLMIEALENEKPIFYMTATIQSHMPYNIDKYDEYDIEVAESTLNEEDTNAIKAYAQGIYDADKELKRLYDYIRKFDEDTMIVFMGDHLPYISNDGEDILQKCKYFNTEDELLNLFRKYNTQTLILTNYEVPKNKEVKRLSTDYLLTYIINNMNINISDYYQWLYKYRKDVPAINKFITIDKDGQMQYNENLEDDIKQIFELREAVQYMLFVE